ncbi:MAG: PocR ligand-binding domain-containing protein [Suilimivivens sp.]
MDKELRLTELVDVDILQRVQDAFSRMTGIAALTTDADGTAVTKGSNFSEFCMKHTRTSPLGCSRCEKCDKYGAEVALKEGKSVTYFCHAGLVDFAAPIMANDKMIGCFIGGQVLSDPPDEDEVRRIAQEIGVEPEEYVLAARKVNIIPKENIDKAAEFLYSIAGILSEITYSRYLVYQANEEIEKAANMKSDFLANMSHEIRTPMNAVIGMAEMVLRENLPDNAREYVNEIKSASKSLLTIINDILDFSKIESGKMDVVPVEYEPMSIINDITNILMMRLEEKDVELILDVDPDIPSRLYGDSDRIKQVILNIANNAVKFTRKGQVVLHVGFTRVSEKDIVLQISVEDTGIGIKKEDLGKLFQSFQQLDSKRNRNIEGTGLGLAISKQLLSLMGGSIHVESEYEKGSTFSFDIPQKVIDGKSSISIKDSRHIVAAGLIVNSYVKKQMRLSVERLGADYIDLAGEEELTLLKDKGVSYLFVEPAFLTEGVRDFIEKNQNITAVLITKAHENMGRDIPNARIVKKPIYTLNLAMIFNNESFHFDSLGDNADFFDFVAPEAEILIVDDNAINLTVAEGLLEPLKMKIDTALSGKEAVEKISAHKYDIVFMDHMMPDMDGVETTHIIRRFHPEYDAVPIIALTANAVGGTMEMFLQEGMNDFVAKPIEIRILVSRVKKWLPAEKIHKLHMTEKAVSKQEVNILPEIGDLDVESAVQLLGSEKLFFSVLRDYYRVIEQKTATIAKLEKEENWTAYTIEVHALKSASRQIGAHSLADKAARLEKAGNEKDSGLIHELTGEMLEQYSAYIAVLKPFFEEGSENHDSGEFITQEVLDTCFAQLREAADNLDIDAMEDVIDEMKKYRYGEKEGNLFTRLQEAVENIDVDACEEILMEWQTQ